MIIKKDIYQHNAIILLVNTNITEIVNEYNKAVAETQKRLRTRTLEPISEKNVLIDDVVVFTGGNTYTFYKYGVGEMITQSSVSIVAVEYLKKYGLCAKIHIGRECYMNVERWFSYRYNGVYELSHSKPKQTAHYIIFSDKFTDLYKHTAKYLAKKLMQLGIFEKVITDIELCDTHSIKDNLICEVKAYIEKDDFISVKYDYFKKQLITSYNGYSYTYDCKKITVENIKHSICGLLTNIISVNKLRSDFILKFLAFISKLKKHEVMYD
jgi:hypothetical protein